MMNGSNNTRIDTVSREIAASSHNVYLAILDRKALAAWLPPNGMTGTVDFFEPWVGGAFQFTLEYLDPELAQAGKSKGNRDVTRGTITKLERNKTVVWETEFISADRHFLGVMETNWILDAVPKGTKVTVTAKNVPEAITKKDHEDGFRASLANLAKYVEGE